MLTIVNIMSITKVVLTSVEGTRYSRGFFLFANHGQPKGIVKIKDIMKFYSLKLNSFSNIIYDSCTIWLDPNAKILETTLLSDRTKVHYICLVYIKSCLVFSLFFFFFGNIWQHILLFLLRHINIYLKGARCINNGSNYKVYQFNSVKSNILDGWSIRLKDRKEDKKSIHLKTFIVT